MDNEGPDRKRSLLVHGLLNTSQRAACVTEVNSTETFLSEVKNPGCRPFPGVNREKSIPVSDKSDRRSSEIERRGKLENENVVLINDFSRTDAAVNINIYL